MSWISTWTGRQVYPLDPKPDQICLEDIAHGLSYKCRYNGQSLFYSVAEHSVLLADWCLAAYELRDEDRRLVALHALLHDAAEAYLPDVTSPIKVLFPKFEEHEDKMLGVIHGALGVPALCPWGAKIIKSVDKRIILNERDRVLPNHDPEAKWIVDGLEPLPHTTIFCWSPEEAYDNFMAYYEELTKTEQYGCKHPWHEQEVDGDKLRCRTCGKRRDIEEV